MLKKYLILLLLSFYCYLAFNQEVTTNINNNKQLERYAYNFELIGDYYSAINYYQKLLLNKPENVKYLTKIGLLYKNTNSLSKAKETFNKLLTLQVNNNIYLYHLAHIYQMLGQYDSCMYYLDKCKIKNLPTELVRLYKLLNSSCNYALQNNYIDNDILIFHLDEKINSKHLDAAPSFLNDSTIIYSTLSGFTNTQLNIFDTTINERLQLFYAKKTDSISWQKDKALPFQINTSNTNISNGIFSLDKTRFYFTKCFKNWENNNICQLYVISYDNGIWTNPEKLPTFINSETFSVTQPAIGTTYNSDLEVIYFSSNRPQGFGGFDIWYTVYNKIKHTYSQPRNVGKRINTSQDEKTPFYNTSTKTLFYSSNGLIGFGGFDIYKNTGELKTWMQSKNLGLPINSNVDDFYYVSNINSKTGFLVSNRKGSYYVYNEYCCYDLFYYKMINTKKLELSGTILAKIDTNISKYLNNGFELRDSNKVIEPLHMLDNAVVSLYLTNNVIQDSIFIATDTTDENGAYSFNIERNQDYKLFVHNENELQEISNVSTKNISDTSSNLITVNQFDLSVLPQQPLIIKNIYYEFGSSELSFLAKSTLDSTLVPLLQENNNIIIEISSHTDSIGSEQFNYNLSNSRAYNVAKYLQSKGVDKDQLIPKGYGESQAIDSNANEKGRKRNRRTEFKILGKTKNKVLNFD